MVIPKSQEQIDGVKGWNSLIWLAQGLIDRIIAEKDITVYDENNPCFSRTRIAEDICGTYSACR